jgi:hypothetical protein
MSVQTNERELAGHVAQQFQALAQRSKLPFTAATAEAGIKTGTTTLFGDIVLWRNREAQDAFALFELKPPFGQQENLKTFREKAIAYRVRFALTWDFQTLTVYHDKNNFQTPLGSESTPVLTRIEDWLRGDIRAKLNGYCRRISDELAHLDLTGKFTKFIPEKVYFVNLIKEVKEQLVPLISQHLFFATGKGEARELLKKYITEMGLVFPTMEEYNTVVAGHITYGLIVKIIFYQTICRYFKDLPDLAEADEDLQQSLQYAFSKAREKDWQAVFEENLLDKLGLPEESYPTIYYFLAELLIYNFNELPEDVIGEMFEEVVDPTERHTLGQFFTSEELVDFVIACGVNNKDGIYSDPTCGSGTFLIRLYDRLRFLSGNQKTHSDILTQIWGFDVSKFPAELATINLFRQDPRDFNNFPRVRNLNTFDLKPNSEFDFPPPKATGNYLKVTVPLPQFAGFVGNFPFIRQELLEKNDPGFKARLTIQFAQHYLESFPELFIIKKKKKDADFFEQLNNTEGPDKLALIKYAVESGVVSLKLSGQADIYAYLYLHTHSLLSPDGKYAMITSNSWLDVSYGGVLKGFFLAHYRIKMIIATWAEPWFDDASVNTVITVLEREPNEERRNTHYVNFVKLKKPIRELVPSLPDRIDSAKRWQQLDAIVTKIEGAVYNPRHTQVAEHVKTLELPEMRIRMVKQDFLQSELDKNMESNKWGQYLRAPDVYFTIIDKCSDILVPLKTVAIVRRGYTTGINDFFYLTPIEEKGERTLCKNARGWEGEIETVYLKRVIKSPKESNKIIIEPEILKNLLFMCPTSIKELKQWNHYGALNYIEWGEMQRTSEGVSWTKVPSVKSRNQWYTLNENEPGKILLQMINNDRFVAFLNETNVQVDHNLFEFLVNENQCEFAAIWLNSYVFALIKEVNSRANLGDGATKTEGVDWNNLMLIPKEPFQIDVDFRSLFKREVLSVDKEIKQKDRIALDTAVLKALGLNPVLYLPQIYDGLCEMVNDRLNLPKLRKKKKVEKVTIAYGQVKSSVVKEVLPDGVRQFPDAFFDPGAHGLPEYTDVEFEELGTHGKPLKVEQFMGRYQLKDPAGNEVFTLTDETRARFAERLTRKNTKLLLLKIPKDPRICAQILSAHDAYIAGLRQTLAADANAKLHNRNAAERLADEIISEYL